MIALFVVDFILIVAGTWTRVEEYACIGWLEFRAFWL